MSRTNYNPKMASYALNSNLAQNERTALAVRLNSSLIRIGKIDVANVPNIKNYKNSKGEKRYIIYKNYPKIYLEKVRNRWLFSKETLKEIDKFNTKAITSKYKRKTTDLLTTSRGDSIKVSFSMATPYNTIVSHLFYIQDSSYNPSHLAKIINGKDKLSKEEKVDKAIKIYQYYLGAPYNWIQLDDISKDENYIDTLSGNHIFVVNPKIPELFLEKVGNEWKYSYTTAEMIDELHESIYPIGAESVFSFGNYFKELIGAKYAKSMFFGMQLYQFVMINFFLLIFLISFLVVKLLVKRIIFKILKRDSDARITYRGILALFLVFFLSWILIFLPALGFGNDVMVILKRVFGAILIFSLTNLGLIATEIWFRVMTRNEPKDTMTARKGAITFVMAILKIVIVVIGAVFIVDKLGFDLAGLLTGISIGGFAFALGAQETIKNFFGSIMIFVDKPFQVGDWVEISGDEGIVEEVGLRTSKIRTFYNSVVIIPNSKVANITIDNYEKRRYRRYKAYYKLPLNTDVEKVEAFVKELENLIETHKLTRKDFYQVRVNNIGLYSIDILFYTFFVVPNWSAELQARHELILAVLKIAKDLGLEFAVPPVVGVDL
jgi:MscS family membrane protein